MGAKPYLTSDGIVSAIKRKITLPESQELLTDKEILAFVNEEMSVSMIPSILSYHEEFFVTRLQEGGDDKVNLKANISRYSIPPRAIGDRIRDLFFQDQDGINSPNPPNLREMVRINPDDRVHFNSNAQISSNNFYRYYLEGNDVVLIPTVGLTPTPIGSLAFTYFLRPNQLVEDTRAAIIRSFKKTILVSNVTLIPGNTITINDVVILTAGTDFAIGGTAIITALNIVNAITALDFEALDINKFTASAVNNLVSILFTSPEITITTSNKVAFNIPETMSFICEDTIPSHISTNIKVDFIQTSGGHQSKALSILTLGVAGTEIIFEDELVPRSLQVGDYICEENECIIPQIPSDLHVDLVERACSRILAAIGDTTGLETVMAKIQQNEAKQGILIDNRVDGSPQKIIQRGGFLRWNRSTRRRF